MARRFFIPFISFLVAAVVGYSWESSKPSNEGFIVPMALVALYIGVIYLVIGLVLLLTMFRKLAKEFLFTALLLLVFGVCVVLNSI